MRTAFIFALAWLAVTAAQGQLRLGAGSFGAGPEAEAHAWLVLEGTGPKEDLAVLVHAGPRGDEHPGGQVEGEFRRVRALREAPEGMAAWGARLWMAFPPASGGVARRVLSVRAMATPMGWAFEPHAILEPHPGLPGRGELLGMAGTRRGPAALVAEDGTLRLLRLEGGAWAEVGLPDGVLDEEGGLRLLAGAEGPVLVRWEAGQVLAWRLVPADGGEGWVEDVLSGEGMPEEAVLLVSGGTGPGDLVGVAVAEGRLAVWLLTPDAAWRMAETPVPPGTRVSAAPLRTQTPRLLVMHGEQGGASGTEGAKDGHGGRAGGGARRVPPPHVLEISLDTGRVLFDGAAQRSAPISSGDFRLLALVLVSLTASVLLVVLRPEGDPGAETLPEGVALAPPGGRLAASLIDLAAAMFVASVITGTPVRELFSGGAGRGGGGGAFGQAWAALPLTLMVGWCLGTLGEWLFGRSLGKALLGMRVAPTGKRARAGLWASMVRNAVKWLLPPVAALALLDPTGRHRGDQLARLAVVVAIEEDEGTGREEGEDPEQKQDGGGEGS